MPVEAVRDHYVATWGPPSRRASFRTADLVAEVYKWDPDATDQGVALYATLGASARPMAGIAPAHRVEFVLALLPPVDDVASALAGLALFATREHVAVGHGDTVPADGPLWPGTEMRRFLLLAPGEPLVETLRLPDGTHVEFLEVIPLYDSEVAYKAEHRAEGLLARWEAADVPSWDPWRGPADLT